MIVRMIGWVLIVAGMVVLGTDIVAGAGTGMLRQTTAGELWFRLSPTSLEEAQAVHPGVVSLLLMPASLMLAVPGFLLILFESWLRRQRG